ncbi:hypothetical protein SAMN05660337_2574 [Maridesulfovibrio ferrireducens]|uniref:Nuclease-related domain-containing protein n=1 Tax=Maridesulfovibrio ferrireducens TaxID=246191 RepID=A0A1G9IYN3_9BACT|nr:hypothetical protein [Maridesulfovibrio ferrireducens]SDL30367.1 hypothetical protein SAMN05660337_2574 [Maridesulfovibrio ferrireducens]
MNDMKSSVSIAGKEVLIFGNESGEEYVYQDLVDQLRRYNIFESLNWIGKKSYHLSKSTNVNSILAYVSMVLIKHCNDHRTKSLDDNGLLNVVQSYLSLKDPLLEDGDGVAYLLRYGAVCWDYARPTVYAIPRTYLLYSKLWGKCNKVTIDLKNDIKEITGLKLEDLLYMACEFHTRSKNGHVLKYKDSNVSLFDDENQNLFFKFVSCDYETFRNECKEIRAGYEKYSFNPLLKFPLIISQKRPYELDVKPYLVPVPDLLLYRVTNGLFFDLAERYRGKKKENPFRTSFGYVFQDYVGELLKRTVPEHQVLPEFKYDKTNDSPDWLLLDGDKLVVIEVKHPILYLNAKQFGEYATVKKDLKQTIGKAAIQLYKFEEAIKSSTDIKLSRFKQCKIQRLIVTYDSGYFLNSFIKDCSEEILKDNLGFVPDNFDFQAISIDDFEYLIGGYGKNLFSFLKNKVITKEHREMDFREYIYCQNNFDQCRNEFLENLLNELLEI